MYPLRIFLFAKGTNKPFYYTPPFFKINLLISRSFNFYQIDAELTDSVAHVFFHLHWLFPDKIKLRLMCQSDSPQVNG